MPKAELEAAVKEALSEHPDADDRRISNVVSGKLKTDVSVPRVQRVRLDLGIGPVIKAHSSA